VTQTLRPSCALIKSRGEIRPVSSPSAPLYATGRLSTDPPVRNPALVVAVPAQRNAITLADRAATVRFVKRDTGRLDAERMITELGPTLVTTPEQTVLDLARRPDLGDAEEEARDAVRILIARADVRLLDELAVAQRARASLRRARDWARTS
jgi:hypothetical protein